MSLDRFIYWQENKPTSFVEIANFLMCYMGCAQKDFSYDNTANQHRWTIGIPGVGCNPNRIIAELPDPVSSDRWFEVVLTDESLDVLTRMQDPFTNAIAEGFAEMIARWYEARREPN